VSAYGERTKVIPIKMLALDLDGTLAIDNHKILPATKEALTELHNQDVEVVIATGRRYRTTRYVIENLGFDVYAVCNGGALVKMPDATTLYESLFSIDQLNKITAIARVLGLPLMAQRDAHDRGGADFVIDDQIAWRPSFQHYFDENRQWGLAADLTSQPAEFVVAATFGEQAKLHALRDRINGLYPDDYTNIIVPPFNTDDCYMEITRRSVSKWQGLQHLMTHFNIPAEALCCVGDELNDLSMLMAATHSVAMGNGNKELHPHVTFICGNHDEDGILEVVDYIRHHNSKC
jgi:Cof subfamily protein (haloacid dehalogenase superfamily)